MEDSEQKRLFVVGLGNPGRKYAGTRHNVGFRVLEALRRRWGLGCGRDNFEGLVWQTSLPGADDQVCARITMLAPMTMMNCSGRAVSQMLKFYKALPEQMLVVLDDAALPVAAIRCRPGGSSGGHNGLDDIITACGTDQIPRLRIGIGPPPPAVDRSDYVLGNFGKAENEMITEATETAADAVEEWIFSDITKVMEKYNRRQEPESEG